MTGPAAARAGSGAGGRAFDATRHGVVADAPNVQTAALQAAIDTAAAAGGGVLRLPPGRFVSGALRLRSGVRLELAEGAVLRGSPDWRDYGRGEWGDALLSADGARDVAVLGPGTIDGAGVERESGEEGFRGPHAMFFARCEDVRVGHLAIRDAGNYAVCCRDVRGATFERLSVRGGHDGVHVQGCSDVRILACDFRTGDDCVAGTDNRGVEASDSRFNSSCNAFRLGALGLTVRRCVFQGPGEYPHAVSAKRGRPRRNMLAAFVHFSPPDRHPRLPSDGWTIEDCVMDRLETVYAYDHERGLWQTGQPARRIRFARIRATGLAAPIRVVGDAARQLDLTLEDVSLKLDEAHAAQSVLDVRRFGALRLGGLALVNDGSGPLIEVAEGDLLQWLADGNAASPAARIQVADVREESTAVVANPP